MSFVALFALAAWVYLALAHGRFWQAGPVLPAATPIDTPTVAIVVPARNEAQFVQPVLKSLVNQDYPGDTDIILVDDNSTDNTGTLAREMVCGNLRVISGKPRPEGWSGKLWAVAQGIEAAGSADVILLCDADIVHDPAHVSSLVAGLQKTGADMVSEMVELSCETFSEKLLIPAFVYFFQMLYPFARVNDPQDATAAAAGGTILVRRAALARIGGIGAVKGQLIDDVALAGAIKKGGPVWIGHSRLAKSIRPYETMADIWQMIARTAFVQLRFSSVLLLLTVIGMALVWLSPPVLALFGHGWPAVAGLVAWAIMAATYLPTLSRFRLSPLWAILMPLIALFYVAATMQSAVNHYTGAGVAWKGRAYSGARA